MKFLVRLLLRLTLLPPVRFIYGIRRIGVDFVPQRGGVLLLGNHVSYIDCFIFYLACPRPVRFMVLESYTNSKAFGWFLLLFGGIPIRPTHPKEAISRTIDALKAGDMVCVFPEGGLTRSGGIGEFKRGFELIARRAECPVVPFYMDGLWHSIFSFERGKSIKKRPHGLFCPLQVAFGRPISSQDATAVRIREAVMEQSVEAFTNRRDFDVPLEVALIRSLKRKRRRPLFVEYGKNGPRDWSRADTLGMATAIARRWMSQSPESGDRIGIMLPSGPMTAVINMGLFLAGKTPVNIPFTVDPNEIRAVAESIAPLGIRTVITSRAFMPHLKDFWLGDEGVFIDMQSVISFRGSLIAVFERLRAKLEPAWLTCWRLDINSRPADREAVALVPRPGEGAVVLRSCDVHRNAVQVRAAEYVRTEDVVFTEESMSSPCGLTLGCWTGVLGEGRIVSRSFSLRADVEAMEKAILEQEATLMVGDRAFFAGIGQSLSIPSLKYGILFGETNQQEIEDWEDTLDLPLARAWSSHGRVVTMSRADTIDPKLAPNQVQRGRLAKSVGRVLPGIAAHVGKSRLHLRFEPIGEENSSGEWLEGPLDPEVELDGFLLFPGADLISAD